MDVSVVIATRDRCDELLVALERLVTLPERPQVLVMDNGSSDDTAETVRRTYPGVVVLPLGHNWGAAARTVGVRLAETPYVAFSDDDSWWAPGALTRAARLLDAYPKLALLAARILVGSRRRLDPTCAAMAASPLTAGPALPGPAVLGFVACGAVVRRQAYLDAGGFDARMGVGGEERLLAIDLAAAGWDLAYTADVVAVHHPSASRDGAGRRRRVVRNDLWTDWLRRPLLPASRLTAAALGRATYDADVRSGILDALRELPTIKRQRRLVPRHVQEALRALDRGTSQQVAAAYEA